MEKVLVTGATGFIGLHCINQLLNQGYAVNGSLRSPERKDEIFDALKNNNTPTDNLNLFTFNLTEDDGWDDGMKGCDYLIHIASPLSVKVHDEDFFVKPAVAGVKRAFKFAKKHNIKKVVLTSSVAAIFESGENKEYFDETDWSDPENPEINHYAKSKTLAEKAAWQFLEENGNPFELAVINPALVVGPTLTRDLGESNKAIGMVVTGKMPVAIPMQFGYVDVRGDPRVRAHRPQHWHPRWRIQASPPYSLPSGPRKPPHLRQRQPSCRPRIEIQLRSNRVHQTRPS